MAENHDIQESDSFRSSSKQKGGYSSNANSARERSPFYDSDSQSDTPPSQGSALSTRSSRSSLVTSGLSTSQPSAENEPEAGSGDNVRVVVRVRPLSQLEVDRGDKNIIKLPGDGAVWIDNSYGQIKPFTFNAAFGEETDQKQIFEECGITQLVDMALEGYSCTAFAFGQTGSGKTYTISGPLSGEETHDEQVLPDADMQGLIERCFQYMFEVMGRNAQTVTYTLKASYLEVYNEKVKDLLNPSSARDSLPVRWSRDRGFYVENLFYVECDALDDLVAVLEEGLKYRQVGSHMWNDHSSRSHSMLTVYVDIETTDSEDDRDFSLVKHGKLSLVDLAGSERVKETKAVGGTFAESQNINKSLLTLGNCISALSDTRKKGGHIPYRDSKLTKLLADSLGGDGVTLMIACISPSSYVVSDTLNTLRYAHRAKRIKNKPIVRMDPKEKLLLSLKREIKLLRTENNYFRQQLGLSNTESQLSVAIDDAAPKRHERAAPLESESKHSLKERQSSNQLTPPDLPGDQTRLNTASMALGANTGLYDMLQQYMMENESLRSENSDLLHNREVMSKERMVVSRENDRLLRKLEHLERIVVSSPMLGRGMSGDLVGRGTDAERASSLPEEYFPAHSGLGSSPQSAAHNRDAVFRVNSGPAQPYPGRRSSSDRSGDSSPSRFPPITNGPYPNYVAQDRWSQPSLAQQPQQQNAYAYNANPRQEALEGAASQGVFERMPDHVTTQGTGPKPQPARTTKKNSVGERQKPSAVNGYAHRFALQKEKKAKELQNRKVSSGAEPRPTQQQAQQAAAPTSGPPVHQEMTSYPAQSSLPPSGPHFNNVPLQPDVAPYPGSGPGMNQPLNNGWQQELSSLDSEIEYYRSAYQPRYNPNVPR